MSSSRRFVRDPNQIAMAGLDGPPVHLLFYALFPKRQAAENMRALAEYLRRVNGLTGSPLLTERLHVSMQNVGIHADIPPRLIEQALEAARRVRMPRFKVAFDRAQSFASRQYELPFVLVGNEGVAGVTELNRRLGQAMMECGLKRWVQSHYTPHATLLYDDRNVAAQPIDVSWDVDEFVLVHSEQGKTTHRRLGAWSLN